MKDGHGAGRESVEGARGALPPKKDRVSIQMSDHRLELEAGAGVKGGVLMCRCRGESLQP